MTQPATKPSATPLRAPDSLLSPKSLHTPAQLLLLAKTKAIGLKQPEDENNTLVLAQAATVEEVALTEAANGSSVAVVEACPVTEPGVADACAPAGAADAHPVAGGAVWLLGLLALGGGGGGGGGTPTPATDLWAVTTIGLGSGTGLGSGNPAPNINSPLKVAYPIDTQNDIGKVVADFDSNKPNAVFHITQVEDNHTGLAVTDHQMWIEDKGVFDADKYTGTDPASYPWFYLDTSTGHVSLTAAGAAAQCIGTSFTLTVQAVADGSTATGYVSFTLDAPTSGNTYNFDTSQLVGIKIIDAGTSSYDVLKIQQGNVDFTEIQILTDGHGLLGLEHSLYVQIGNNYAQVANHFNSDGSAGTAPLEYISFTEQGNYYSYDFGTDAELSYYHVAPTASSELKSTVDGTGCNDLLYGDAVAAYGETFNGGIGNDLIFAGPIFSGAPGNWTPATLGIGDTLNGGAGNDLLVGAPGVDILNGDTGNDVLIGGYGHDTLTGGAGVDIFVFNAPKDAAHADTITDFTVGEDKIYLDKTVFGADALTGNHLDYNAGTGVLTYDGTLFATLSNTPTLVLDQSNFIVA
jgi:Ca2+-binding RTX toxin-like protein